MSQVMSRCSEKIRVSKSESAYHEKLFTGIMNLIDAFREPSS